jgi:transposase
LSAWYTPADYGWYTLADYDWYIIARLMTIHQRFGVRYHHDYIGPLLRQLGWSPQRPVVRASQRDEAAIEQWVETTWPALQKKR